MIAFGRLRQLFARVNSRRRLVLLRLVYGSRFQVGVSVGVRRRFTVNLSGRDARLIIGDRCSFNNDCSINSHQLISIGSDCIIGEGVRFYDHNHEFADSRRPIRDQGFKKAPIFIGDNCWIGSGVTVLPGVTIGAGSVIAAGVVVVKDVPEYSVVIAKQDLVVRTRRPL